jgi:hypothetical protein
MTSETRTTMCTQYATKMIHVLTVHPVQTTAGERTGERENIMSTLYIQRGSIQIDTGNGVASTRVIRC